MSTNTPTLELIELQNSISRFEILRIPLSEPSSWHIFHGFDRPSVLIKRYTDLGHFSRNYLSLRRLLTRRTAFSFMKENDVFFRSDILDTESWIQTHIPLLTEYLSVLPDITHIPWRTGTIHLCVHAINYAFSHGTTVVVGIRPPHVLTHEERLLMVLHELVHVNLDTLPFELDLEEEYIMAAGEVLALYFTYTLLSHIHQEQFATARVLFMNQWREHGLAPEDLSVLKKKIISCDTQTTLKEMLRAETFIRILKCYHPIDYTKIAT